MRTSWTKVRQLVPAAQLLRSRSAKACDGWWAVTKALEKTAALQKAQLIA